MTNTAVLLALLSPRFLYREVGGGPDAYDTAGRLSFGLWDSIAADHAEVRHHLAHRLVAEYAPQVLGSQPRLCPSHAARRA